MTDTFDELIDEVVNAELCATDEHEWRDKMITDAKTRRDTARTSLRAAIDEVVKERDKFKAFGYEFIWGEDNPDEYQSRVAALEAQLKEADADAERLRIHLEAIITGKKIISPIGAYKAIELHVARLSKRGQG